MVEDEPGVALGLEDTLRLEGYDDRDEQGVSGLYQAPTQGGGGPRRLGAYPTDALSSILSVSPDVQKFFVSFQVPEGRPQYWIVGNYLPPRLRAFRRRGAAPRGRGPPGPVTSMIHEVPPPRGPTATTAGSALPHHEEAGPLSKAVLPHGVTSER